MNTTNSFDFGFAIAATLTGQKIDKRAAVLDSEPFDRWALQIGATAFREAGEMGSLGYDLCKRAAEAPQWSRQFTELADVVITSLGRCAAREKAAALAEDMPTVGEAKRASMNWLSALLAGGASRMPDLAKLLAGAAVLTGGAGGSLAWLANRSINEDDDDIEAMKSKIRTYRGLTDDIKAEMANRGLAGAV